LSFILISKKNIKFRKIFSHDEKSSEELPTNSLSFAPTFYKGSNCHKFLWIRLALLNKSLTKIIEFILSNPVGQFYSAYALCSDPVDSAIFSSLLIGPCALEYTRIKMNDTFLNDPNADELIQRHRMHSSINQFSTSLSSNSSLQLPNQLSISSGVKSNKTSIKNESKNGENQMGH
jgi:hypothetical protein